MQDLTVEAAVAQQHPDVAADRAGTIRTSSSMAFVNPATLQSPHLVNLSEDSVLCGSLVYPISVGVTRVGTAAASKPQVCGCVCVCSSSSSSCCCCCCCRSCCCFRTRARSVLCCACTAQNILLGGLGVRSQHCLLLHATATVDKEKDKDPPVVKSVVAVRPGKHSDVYVNGRLVAADTKLNHGDRCDCVLVFGTVAMA